MPDDAHDVIPAGTRVQVRSRFDDRWVSGFEIADVEHGDHPEYRLKRLSDQRVLPAAFPPGQLRLEG